ncbi:MAG: hypothetical protein Q8L08_00995 [Candidatus Nanopelagicaceae bacterium]|nr:hypothetical protein [Candidatus Nanopelagicaceae bacterium]
MIKERKRGTFFTSALLILTLGSFLPISVSAFAAEATTKVKRTSTLVGGDIHTLTFTKNGIFVTGHQAGSNSTNEGIKWRNIPSINNADIMGWATTNLGYLAGGHNGLFRSTNGGKTFARFNFYSKVSDVHSLGAAGKIVYLGSPQVGFLRSTDSGKSWKVANSKFGQGFMGSMLVDPVNPLRVIAPDMSNGLVITTDGGKSWARFGGPEGAMSIDWNKKNRKEIVALGMGIGARTKDNGKTWSAFPVPMGASAIALNPNGSRMFVAILVGNRASILSSDDVGKHWA